MSECVCVCERERENEREKISNFKSIISLKDWDNNCCGGGKKSVKSEFCTFIEVRRKYTNSCPPHHTRSVGMSFQSDRRDFKTRKINIEKIDLSLEIHNALAAVESRRVSVVFCVS